jgi:pimeloyl-ACP methyl ester carboxylesterase
MFEENTSNRRHFLAIAAMTIAAPPLGMIGCAKAEGIGEGVVNTMKPSADDVQTVVIPETGHWVAEQAPEELLAALRAFLAPYREGGGGSR